MSSNMAFRGRTDGPSAGNSSSYTVSPAERLAVSRPWAPNTPTYRRSVVYSPSATVGTVTRKPPSPDDFVTKIPAPQPNTFDQSFG